MLSALPKRSVTDFNSPPEGEEQQFVNRYQWLGLRPKKCIGKREENIKRWTLRQLWIKIDEVNKLDRIRVACCTMSFWVIFFILLLDSGQEGHGLTSMQHKFNACWRGTQRKMESLRLPEIPDLDIGDFESDSTAALLDMCSFLRANIELYVSYYFPQVSLL